MKKRIVCACVMVLMVFILTGCCLSHDWQAATCDAPKTCAKCGETEGEKLEHVWVDATCEAPKTCSVCAATEGNAKGHDFTKKISTTEYLCAPATLECAAEYYYACSNCGEKDTATYTFGLPREPGWEVYEGYITLVDPFEGTYSDEYTEDSSLKGKIAYYYRGQIALAILIDGNMVENNTPNDIEYRITLKDDEGNGDEVYAVLYPGEKGILIKEDDRDKVAYLMKNAESIQFYVEQLASTTVYQFKVNVTDFLYVLRKAPPAQITVLDQSGFCVSEDTYFENLDRYLPDEYTIVEHELGDRRVIDDGDGYDEITIFWEEGEEGYKDCITFCADTHWAIEEFLEEFVMSIAPEAAEKYMDDIMTMWIAARDLRTGEYLPIPLSDTEVLVVYRGHSGYQAMFCTSRFVRGY